jgi:hypothetical protein
MLMLNVFTTQGQTYVCEAGATYQNKKEIANVCRKLGYAVGDYMVNTVSWDVYDSQPGWWIYNSNGPYNRFIELRNAPPSNSITLTLDEWLTMISNVEKVEKMVIDKHEGNPNK